MLLKLLRWANLLLLSVTFLAFAAPEFDPRRFWLPSFIAHAFPFLLLLHVGFIVVWIVLRRWYFLFSLGCLVLGWGYVSRYVTLHVPAPPADDQIRVISYNIYMLRNLPKLPPPQRGKQEGEFFAFFERITPPDVLCLQECSNQQADHIAGKLGYRHTHFLKNKGTAILSRHPIIASGGAGFEKSHNSFVWADLEIKGKTLRFYSVHLQSNRITEDAARVEEEGGLQNPESWDEARGILAKTRTATRRRAAQADIVGSHIAKSPHPVVVCGDLNDPPLSYSYRILTEAGDLQDGFRRKGYGAGTTFAGLLPTLRIDYILAGREFQLKEYRKFKKDFSDHYPVLCRMELPPSE